MKKMADQEDPPMNKTINSSFGNVDLTSDKYSDKHQKYKPQKLNHPSYLSVYNQQMKLGNNTSNIANNNMSRAKNPSF